MGNVTLQLSPNSEHGFAMQVPCTVLAKSRVGLAKRTKAQAMVSTPILEASALHLA